MTTAEQRQSEIVSTLVAKHPLFAAVTVRRWVAEAFESFRGAKVQAYVPVLAQRQVESRLRDLEGNGSRAELDLTALATLAPR